LAENALAVSDQVHKATGSKKNIDTLGQRLKGLQEAELSRERFAILHRGVLIKQGCGVSAAKRLIQDAQDDIRIARFRKQLKNDDNPWVDAVITFLGLGFGFILGAARNSTRCRTSPCSLASDRRKRSSPRVFAMLTGNHLVGEVVSSLESLSRRARLAKASG